MILYRKEPYPLQMKNIILLDDNALGGVVYVGKQTYDQALLLHSRFDGNVQRVIDTLKNKKTEAYIAIPGLSGLISYMAKVMPEPLNILAPFLMFCTQNQGIEWNDKDVEFAYGILHQYSQMVDFNAMTLVPAEVRANVTLPTALLKQYKASWDDLCSTLEDKVVLGNMQPVVQQVVQPVVQQPVQPIQPVQQVQTPVTYTVVSEPKKEEPKKEEPSGEMSEMEKKLMEIRKRAEERDKAIAKPAPTPVAKPVSASTSKTEAEQNAALLSEYDC